MATAQVAPDVGLRLQPLFCNEELHHRKARKPNHEALAHGLVALAQTMAASPELFYQQLAEVALTLCRGHSAGVSMPEEKHGVQFYRVRGITGECKPDLNGGIPREASPCALVRDPGKVRLLAGFDPHVSHFTEREPPIVEALLLPFGAEGEKEGGENTGTLWVLSHNPIRRFDAEDARVLATLGDFVTAAYQSMAAAAHFKNIISNIWEPLLVLGPELRIATASRSFCETFQLEKESVEGCLLDQLGHGDWKIPGLLQRLARFLAAADETDSFEITHDFPSLGRRALRLNARKLLSQQGLATLIVLGVQDITIGKRMEEELRRSQEDSQRFAYVAAHDLRAPMNTSSALLDLFDRRAGAALGNTDRKLLTLARTNLERLKTLMNDILAFTQIGGAKKTSVAPLQGSLEIALGDLAKEIEENGAAVEYGALPSLRADHSLLAVVFQNLVSNALKYRAQAAPHIRIESQRLNQEWVISVSDNGQGFDPKYAEKIFQPFERLHGSGIPGTGIGLATCKRIIEHSGGRIWAESVAGRGAKFCFTLPDE